MFTAKSCPALDVPKHANLSYKNENTGLVYNAADTNSSTPSMPIDTKCSIKCENGLILDGSSIRNCLGDSSWDGVQPTCQGTTCFNKFCRF